MWDFACLSLEISIEYLSFPFCFQVILLLTLVFFVVSSRWNWPFSDLFLVFQSSYRCIDTIFNAGKSLLSFLDTYHHHHHVALVVRISLTRSRHSSLSFIALGRSSGQHSISSHSCWIYVRAGRPAFAQPCVGSIRVHLLWVRPCFSAVFCMSGSSNLNSFRDRGQVAVQLVSCGVLPPGLVQDCTQHSCVIVV